MKERMKNTKGITLIALIITIIILLILAMVTIRILMNQGIIKHAQNATTAYNEAQNNELEYLTYAEGEMDKYAGGGSGGVDTSEDLDKLRRYFLGVKEDGNINENGQSIMNVLNTEKEDPNGFMGVAFKDDENTIGSGSNLSASMVNYGFESRCYAKYKNKAMYQLVLDSEFNVKDVIFVYSPQGAEGETRTYKGEQWTVLYDKGDTLELVSQKTIGTYTLGMNDPNATGNTDIEKAINSYNNAVERLNTYCRTTLGDNTARSVGSKPNTPDTDTTETYSSTNTEIWNTDYNNVGKVGDNNAEQDFVRMLYHGISQVKNSDGNATDYWLASRYVYESRAVYFDIWRTMEQNASGHYIWDVDCDGAETRSTGDETMGVRACVTVAK